MADTPLEFDGPAILGQFAPWASADLHPVPAANVPAIATGLPVLGDYGHGTWLVIHSGIQTGVLKLILRDSSGNRVGAFYGPVKADDTTVVVCEDSYEDARQALEIAGSGGGTIIITPITSTVGPGDVERGNFTAFRGSAGSATFIVIDAAGNAVDLRGLDLDFVVAVRRGANLFVLSSDGIPAGVVAGGTGGNQITVSWLQPAFASAPDTVEYALRQRSDGHPWAIGSINVETLPDLPV